MRESITVSCHCRKRHCYHHHHHHHMKEQEDLTKAADQAGRDKARHNEAMPCEQ